MKNLFKSLGAFLYVLVRLFITTQVGFFMIRECYRGHYMQASIFAALLLLTIQRDFEKDESVAPNPPNQV